MLILFFLALRFVLVAMFVFIVVALFRGAPFMPMPPIVVGKMTALMNVGAGEKLVELGSGDGRLVISLARAGAEVHGYEINPFLVLWSRFNIFRAGVSGKAFIHWADFWRRDVSSFNGVALYGISHIMVKLEKKLTRELKPGSKVVSYVFTFPDWQATQQDGNVYLYEVPGYGSK